MRNLVRTLFLSVLMSGAVRAAPVPPDAERSLRLADGGTGMFYGLDGRWVGDQTRVTVDCTEKELIVRFEAFFPPGSPRRRVGKAAEPLSIFPGEHTEVLLVPGTEQRVYYHFAVNPANQVYHARRRDAAWSAPGVRITAAPGRGCWTSEYRIPFAALGVKRPEPGTVWRINFCRLSAAENGAAVWSSWNHSGSYHDLSTMGALVFERAERNAPFVPVREAELTAAGLTLALAGPTDWRIAAECDGAAWPLSGAADGKLTFRPVRRAEFRRLKSDGVVTLNLSAPDGRRLQVRSALKRPGRDPLVPDRFYCSGDRVVCRVDGFGGTLRLLDASGRELRRAAVRDGVGALDLRGIAPGSCIVEYADGARRTTRTIVRCGVLPPPDLPAGRLVCDRRGFRRGDRRFYLLGLAAEPDAAVFPFPPGFTFGLERGLARNAVKLGSVPGGRIIRVVHLSRLLHERKRQEADFANFFREVRVASDRMYRLEYEAGLPLYFGESPSAMTLCANPPGWYKWLGRTAKRLAPRMLTSIHSDSQSQLAEYAEAADVLEFSDWTASFAEDDMMRHLPGALYRLRRAVPDKPTVFWLGGSIPDGHSRTPEELRAGIYLSIIYGCVGNVIHTGHGNIPAERTRMWSFLCGITRELAGFYPEFAAGEPYEYPLPAGFSGRAVRLPDGEVMLVAVNLVDGENRLTTPAGTRLFTPYEPAVLRWRETAR